MNRRRTGLPEDVFFPVVPMLDMSFQLLAFFILTFRPPTGERRIDLVLPAAPVALPRPSTAPPNVIGIETNLVVTARADRQGRLATLRLDRLELESPAALADRLKQYAAILDGRPLHVTLAADDTLQYDDTAKLLGACAQAGVGTVRLAPAPQGPGGAP